MSGRAEVDHVVLNGLAVVRCGSSHIVKTAPSANLGIVFGEADPSFSCSYKSARSFNRAIVSRSMR
jgi:hypothetical protein